MQKGTSTVWKKKGYRFLFMLLTLHGVLSRVVALSFTVSMAITVFCTFCKRRSGAETETASSRILKIFLWEKICFSWKTISLFYHYDSLFHISNKYLSKVRKPWYVMHASTVHLGDLFASGLVSSLFAVGHLNYWERSWYQNRRIAACWKILAFFTENKIWNSFYVR